MAQTYNGLTIENENVPTEIWEEIKTKNGVYRSGDFDFIVWTDELEETEYTQTTLDYVNNILDTNQNVRQIHFA